MPWAHSAALKQQIENKLASRIPSALSPAVQQEPRLLPIGIPAVEALLGGGLPLGGISEFTGPATSGRTSLALALLGEATAEAACAYIDVSSSLDPKSAAAAGVRLENLLWVRFDVPPAAAIGPQKTVVTVQPLESPRPGWGWTHPRTETKGIAPALETMLVEKAQARLQKAAGTPGFPNRKLELKAMPPACDPDSKLGLAAVSDDQVAYDRFNARRTDEADPRRRQDVAAAAQARELARRARPTLPSCAASENPWARLDKAIRATDQVLQSGGFRVVVLDLASVPAEQAYRIPAATWFRFRRAAQLGDAVLLLLTEQPCARSSAACVLACAPGHSADLLGTLSQTAEVARQRSGAMPPLRKAPGRAATWDAVPQWMRAAGGMSMAYAAIHIPEFPAVAWLRREPGMGLEACAVLEGAAPAERVASLNRAARRFGVEHGMSKVQAETFGALRFHARSAAEEAAAVEDVLAVLETFSPRVELVAAPANNYAGRRQPALSALLDQAGTERLFGDAASYAHSLSAALRAKQFPANIAAAPNAEAALLLAANCRGVTTVALEETAARLAPLPVMALACDGATLEVLSRWGIRTLGELAALPPAALVSRIGQQGRRLQQLARGHAERLLVPGEPAFTLSESVTLDTPLEMLDSLLFVLSPMLERVLARAMERAYALRAVAVTLSLEKMPPHVLRVQPAVPTQSRDLLLKLFNLELQARPPRAAIGAVALTAEPARPQTAQRGLFQAQFPDPGKLDLLLARLRSIAGEDSIGSPELVNSHGEDEHRLRPFRPNSANTPRPCSPTRLALRRLRPPQGARVLLRDGAPRALYWQGARLELEAATGPWQSSGYWWDSRHWEAEEWDAITAAPRQALRLRYEPGSRTWSVTGVYD